MERKQVNVYEDYLKMLFADYVHGVICHSKAGLGKTYNTIKILKKHKKEYIYNSGVTTAVALYKLLQDNNDKIIILDDIETIFKDERIINILKAALWEVDGQRTISYKSSAKTLEDYKESFIYTGGIIILANEIKGKNDESYKALMSRCLKYELNYTYNEILLLSKEIINERKDLTIIQQNVAISIIDNCISPKHFFNFRLLDRLICFIKYNIEKAEMLFKNSLDIDEELSILMDIINNNKTVKEQVKQYINVTGQSRMTFFRKKKKLKKEGLI